MLRNAIYKYKINVFSGSSNLYFHMGKIGIMPLSFINQGCFDFSLPLVPELRCRDPFSVKVKFPSGGETDDVILFQLIKL